MEQELKIGVAFQWRGFASPDAVAEAEKYLAAQGFEVASWDATNALPNTAVQVLVGRRPTPSIERALKVQESFETEAVPVAVNKLRSDDPTRFIVRLYSPTRRLPWLFAPVQNAVLLNPA